LYDEIEKTEDALTMSETRLVKAKAQLAKANSDLQNLDNQKLELVSISDDRPLRGSGIADIIKGRHPGNPS
jgi:hypothetical protein